MAGQGFVTRRDMHQLEMIRYLDTGAPALMN